MDSLKDKKKQYEECLIEAAIYRDPVFASTDNQYTGNDSYMSQKTRDAKNLLKEITEMEESAKR